jgi:hypothetical protein
MVKCLFLQRGYALDTIHGVTSRALAACIRQARLQVLSLLQVVSAGKAMRAKLHNVERLDPQIQGCLTAQLAACRVAAVNKVAGAAQFEYLLQVLQLMLHADAADIAAGLVLDLQPVVNEVFGAAVPEPGAPEGEGLLREDEKAEGGGKRAGAGWVNQLTECLLALLADSVGSVPVAVVRAAVQGVWRAMATHANALALSDLLQIVLRIDRKVASGDLFEGDEDEDGEEVEEEREHDADDVSGTSPVTAIAVPLALSMPVHSITASMLHCL